MYFATEGVILKKRNFGEADRLLTIFTRDHGKITAIAKGARRPRSKKAGHIELGNWCKLFVARGKNIDLVTEAETKRAFGIANFTEERANRIYHLLEIVENLTASHQKNLEVFILLVQFLKRIEKDEQFSLLSCVFKIKLLSSLGFFTSHYLKNPKVKYILATFEKDNFETIKGKIKLTQNSYSNILLFLDRLIEGLTQSKLTTSRFLNGI
ncbi:DNA repair protein RecO [Candidatus Curtissbacteria bacterium]|nr:DNA repair protein RecO [Candidatus Curtissbacteria bacterium]